MGDTAEDTIRDYYDALRAGEPLHPFFADTGPVVKVGIGERMTGADAVADGLRAQTRTTADWEVASRDLHVGTVGSRGEPPVEEAVDGEPTGEPSCYAWFGDDVFMAWTDTDRGVRFEFDTRWSGALVWQNETGESGGEWRFVEMHVSVPGET